MRFDFFLIFMSSTRNRSTATKMCRMKKTTDAIAGIASEESVRVALFQTLGEDGVIWINASLKSERSLVGPIFSRLIDERSTNSFCASEVLIFRHSIGEIFLRVLVHLDADFFSSINAELRFAKYGIVLEAIVNPFKTFLDASLSQIMVNNVFSLFFSLPITMAMRSTLLDDIVRD